MATDIAVKRLTGQTRGGYRSDSVTRSRTVVVLLAAIVSGLRAQSPAFEAASIKASKSVESRAFGYSPGRWRVTNYTLRAIIRAVWTLPEQQVIGGPAWIDQDRFDIEAVHAGRATSDQHAAMAKTLLADRFKLVVHTETRPVPTYALRVARADGRLGPRLRRSTANCATDTRAPSLILEPLDGIDFPVCGITTGDATVRAGGIPLALFTRTLAAAAGRIIVDSTGLAGRFDLVLAFNRNLSDASSDVPSLFAAVQEQLGLALEAQTVPLEVLIIDSAAKPSED